MTTSEVPSATFDAAQQGWVRRETNPFFESYEPLWIKGAGEDYVTGVVCAPNMLNGYGIMHGGATAAVWDQFLGCTVADVVLAGSGQAAVTIQLNINFMAAVRAGDFIIGHGRVPRRTRSLIFVEGTMTVDDEVVSSAQAVFKIVRGVP
jgi:uncharacterized protein (TIGR00369 family)